jgi:hypothetical protein
MTECSECNQIIIQHLRSQSICKLTLSNHLPTLLLGFMVDLLVVVEKKIK